ncbi:MAG: hypothetical protein O2840_01015 [bacterium]|nr:hypothetical protein [bacterium]
MHAKLNAITKQRLVYAALFAGIVLLQVIFTMLSSAFITHEELAESVRNVWWLHNNNIYDGISSNVGWYMSVLAAYNLFGFSLFMGKAVKLVIFAMGLTCAFDLSLKYVGRKFAWVPLILFGLSPSLLYFNTLQTSFAIDVPFFFISVWLLERFSTSNRVIILLLFGFVLTLASLSYPAFILYLPVLGILFVHSILTYKSKRIAIATLTLGLLLPVLFLLLYLKEPSRLLFDPQVNSGVFRGGGTFPDNWSEAASNIRSGAHILYTDLFVVPQSYYFDAARSEFSHWMTRFSVYLVFILACVHIIKSLLQKNYFKLYIPVLAFFSLLVGGILANLSNWFPGLRRATILLIAFYVLIAWLFRLLQRKELGHISAIALIGASLIIILHHLKVIPPSLAALSVANKNSELACFNISGAYPAESLEMLRAQMQLGGTLDLSLVPNANDCRLAEIYTAIASDCYWNERDCKLILWHDEKSNKTIPLQTTLWDSYYFPH